MLSDPIEENDLYRYVWDGAVSTQGVIPFRYSPHQVLASSADDALPDDLARLVRLRDRSPELAAILRRVHFGELPTIYPPVSQLVFAMCSWLTPDESSRTTRLMLMKAWFVAFDLLTLGLLLRLLGQAGRPRGWSLAYGWCPLVVKEIANSGHLDSLATCLAMLAISFTVLAIITSLEQRRRRWGLAMATAALLALGVGAKFFPVVLAPLLLWMLVKRVGWWTATSAGVAFIALSADLLGTLKKMMSTIGRRYSNEWACTHVACSHSRDRSRTNRTGSNTDFPVTEKRTSSAKSRRLRERSSKNKSYTQRIPRTFSSGRASIQ